MPLNIRLHFYRSPVGQIVPETEQLTLAFFDTIGLMVQTIGRKSGVEVVCDTPNDRDTRVIVSAMNDASFTLRNVPPKAASSSAPRAPLSFPTWARLRSNENEFHAV